MAYVNKTVVDSDFCIEVLCWSSNVYFIKSSSMDIYDVKNGRFRHIKTIRFFDVVKSATIIEKRIVVVFNGYLTIFNNVDCNKYNFPSVDCKVLDNSIECETYETCPASLRAGKHVFGRCSINYQNVGAHVAHVFRSICLASFFGNLVFYSTDIELTDPVEHFTEGTILDFKAAVGKRQVYLSLERRGKDVFLKTYEHVAGSVTIGKEFSVPDGYLLAPLANGSCVVFSNNGKIFLTKNFTDIEIYVVPGLCREKRSLEESQSQEECLFTCFSSYETDSSSSILVLNEEGDVLKLDVGDKPSATYISTINPSKSMKIHKDGFLVSAGYDSDDCIYCLRSYEWKEGSVFEQTDCLGNFGVSRTSTFIHDRFHRVYFSNVSSMREVVKRNPLVLSSDHDISEESKGKKIEKIFASENFLCTTHEENMCNSFILDEGKLVHLYELELSGVVCYMRLDSSDIYLTTDSVVVVCVHDKYKESNTNPVSMKGGTLFEGLTCTKISTVEGRRHSFQNTLEGNPKVDQKLSVESGTSEEFFSVVQYRVNYDTFSVSSSSLLLADENRITRISMEGMKLIELNFAILGLTSNQKYLFVLTGRRVVRTYDLFLKKWVFIQSFHFDVMSIYFFQEYLYVIGEKVYKLRVYGDGSFSFPRWITCAGTPVGFGKGIIVFENTVVDLVSEEFFEISGYPIAFVSGIFVIAEGCRLKTYEYERNGKLSSEILEKDDSHRLLFERVCVENHERTFKIKEVCGSVLMEDIGRVIWFSSSDYQVVLVCKRGGSWGNSDECEESIGALHCVEKKYLRIYKDIGFLYEFEAPIGVDVVATIGRMIYCGDGAVLYGYEIGKRALLKKIKLVLPSKILRIFLDGETVLIGTEKDSVWIVREGKLVCGEPSQRRIVALGRMSDDCFVVGDGLGNILIMKAIDNGLTIEASLFANDMPIQITSGDRVFVAFSSGKVCEVVEVDDQLSRLFLEVEAEIKNWLEISFFGIFLRYMFFDAEYLKMFFKLNDEHIKRVSERTGICIEKIYDIIGVL